MGGALALLLFVTAPHTVAENRLRCATPVATTTANGALHRTWINVYTKASHTATIMSFTIAAPLSLWVVAESGGFSRVTTGDSTAGWPFRPRAPLGWVRTSEIEDEPIRNCT
jgi:hypothetical protein